MKFVKYFEDFVQEAEICWEPIKKDSYEKLSNIYDGIVREIFKAIDEIAGGSLKTPSEVVLFQNYHYMNRKNLNNIQIESLIVFRHYAQHEWIKRID